MPRPVIANWKMNLSLEAARNLCLQLVEETNLLIAAPTLYLGHLAHEFPNLNFASQDVSIVQEDFGPFTGEVSAKMLAETGVRCTIVGHSERRAKFAETNKTVKQKAENCLKAGIKPIVCIGETLSSRLNGEYMSYIEEQLLESIPDEGFMIAYEPVWAIGTGVIPNREQLQEVYEFLEKTFAKSVCLVYGGSVNSGNALVIKATTQIDGLLLGGASLNLSELKKILQVW